MTKARLSPIYCALVLCGLSFWYFSVHLLWFFRRASISYSPCSPSPQPIPSPPATPPPPPLTNAGRPRRNYCLPTRFEDVLPEPPAAVLVATAPAGPRRVILHVRDTMHSDLANVHVPPPPEEPSEDPPAASLDPPWPFRNMSIYRLMHWANSGSNSKSEGEVTRLVSEVISADDFRAEDLANFSAN
ncbi:hypothetical protein K438DRAFT_1756982 [Mycena galopus ATCC 62051]|nr:hypothetical protein K438DRAFT_1756982 [Mycena galopus ATCC 62051]